jgi:RNA polymerase sigma factor (TIGR02999 family)
MANAKRATASMATANPDDSITSLLAQLGQGDRQAEAQLVPRVYDELRRVARRYMRLERANHTLQPTALVNEAYLRMVEEPHLHWKDRVHFFATAAQLMRHILVDHARARHAGKRGGVQSQITLDENLVPAPSPPVDILSLHEALERLSKLDARQGRIVELHFFGGLSFEEIASVLQVSERTVKRDWAMARIWLFKEISG